MKKSCASAAMSVVTTIGLFAASASAEYATGEFPGHANGDHGRLFSGDTMVSRMATPTTPGSAAWLVSPSGQYVFVLQTDCNVVFYDSWHGWTPLWASNTYLHSRDVTRCELRMQTDGNLVHYQCNSDACYAADFATNTAGYPGAHFSVQNDHNFVLYSGNTVGSESAATALWALWGH